ncbi:hypothetical protein [Sphingomonas mollis]|uniref:DUF1570 domain-containing protein n=1 Tax=Sphingomonas mollis TaxID=2795726 RepID=A0ABS0XK83_9SPHN|nr:hypothetical protein [Sphingomonas sp. BT553]MBJ6120441.1 hypothetical protein [Sphingomonas sp. BT553]
MARWRRLGCAMAALAVASPASAAWRLARSPHFIVYSDGNEAALREKVTRLEQLDALMQMLGRVDVPDEDRRANPLTVFIVDDMGEVQELFGEGGRNIGGFYIPRATGSIAFTPARFPNGTEPDNVLFHEYAHHYLLGTYAAPYPGWFSEGFAEYIGVTAFERDKVRFGMPANHRVMALRTNPVPVERLFAFGTAKLSDGDREAMYSRGWLLTHYLFSNAERGKQFDAYLAAIAAGKSSVAAAQESFGDVGVLNKELNTYLSRNRFTVKEIPRARLGSPDITITTLNRTQAAMIPLRMRSTRGVGRQTAQPIYARAIAIAAEAPGDALVQGWLAEMAYDAGEDIAAEAAADRALAADPRSVQALLYKARVRLRRAAATRADDAGWKEARSWIVKANRVDNNDAAALSLYYQSFMMERRRPNTAAIDGLLRASQLVSQDPSLRWLSARELLRRGDVAGAKAALRPLAFNPHAAADNPAAKLVAQLDGMDEKAARAFAERDAQSMDDQQKTD